VTLAVGTRIGRFVVHELLGAGGMGEVYRARDSELDREVALKVLRTEGAAAPERVRRFEREARAAARLRHPNVIAIFDVGTHGGTPYVVTELLDGETLRTRLERGPLPMPEALRISRAVARALDAAHTSAIVHRDLKPENVFLTRTDETKLLDFGVAKLLPEPIGERAHASGSTVSLETEPGLVVGTVGYMAPEQVRGGALDHRADLFALGAILYEMLAGRPAFPGHTSVERLAAILKESPPKLLADDHTRAAQTVRLIVERCLEKDPESRWRDAATVGAELLRAERFLGEGAQPTSWFSSALGRPARKAATVGLGVAAVAAIAFFGGWTVRAMRVESPAPAAAFDTPSAAPAPGAPRFERLTFRSGGVTSARFAPDGMTVAFGAFFAGEPLRVHVVRTDSPAARALEIEGDVLAVSQTGEMAVSLGRRLVPWPDVGTLGVSPLMSGAARPLLEGVQDAAFERDGETLAVARYEDGHAVLERPRGTKVFETDGWISNVRFDPSGTRVAFLNHPYFGDSIGGVTVLDERGQELELVTGWMDVNGLAWSPDGSEVWFSGASERGPLEIAAVDMAGRVRQVFQGPGRLVLQDIAPDGRALITVDDWRAIAVFHDAHGDHDVSILDQSVVFDLSSDGANVLLSEQSAAGRAGYDIYLTPSRGGPPMLLGEGLGTSISRDGRWVLRVDQRESSLVLIPTGAGETRRLQHPGYDISFARFSPSGEKIASLASRAGEGPRPYVFAAGGAEPPQMAGPEDTWAQATMLQDDQTIVARTRDGELWAFGGSAGAGGRRITRLGPEHAIVGPADGRKVYLLKRGSRPGVVSTLDTETGELAEVTTISPDAAAGFVEVATFAPGPAGTYAYTYFRQLSTLFVVEGLR
jgi:Tol biopolymer transport system component